MQNVKITVATILLGGWVCVTCTQTHPLLSGRPESPSCNVCFSLGDGAKQEDPALAQPSHAHSFLQISSLPPPIQQRPTSHPPALPWLAAEVFVTAVRCALASRGCLIVIKKNLAQAALCLLRHAVLLQGVWGQEQCSRETRLRLSSAEEVSRELLLTQEAQDFIIRALTQDYHSTETLQRDTDVFLWNLCVHFDLRL